jgi:hypothetical protein
LRPLVIVVKGTCTEDVLIERNRVTLVAATPRVDGIVGKTDGGAAIKVAGAQNVVIDGLRVRSADKGSSSAVWVTGNGEATIKNTLIEDSGTGIWANHGGFFLLQTSEILGGHEYALLLSDAGNARVESSVLEVNNSDEDFAAIGAFRSINIRLRGNNKIRNNGNNKIPGDDDDGLSLSLFHQVELRQDGGHTVFIGPMQFGNLTHASLRDPEIMGGIELFGGSHADIRKSSTGPNEITGGVHTGVFDNSELVLRSGTTAELGSVIVFEYSSLKMGNGINLTADGGMNLGNATLNLGSDSKVSTKWINANQISNLFVGNNTSVEVDESVNLHGSVLGMGTGSNMTADGGINLGNAVLTLSAGSKVMVGNDFSAFNRSEVAVFGPDASLEVAGNMTGGAFFSMNIGDHASLVVHGVLRIDDFSLMFASSHTTITADMEFGGSATKVNFFGNDVTYNGNMSFFDKGDMTFGFNNVINGSVDCHGGNFAGPVPTVMSGPGIINCF